MEFPELEEEVERAIRELDGAVVPKLNWSSPKVGPPLLSATHLCTRFDQSMQASLVWALGSTYVPIAQDASWMSVGGTLNCSSFADICLLLKSSDFVSHDLSYAYARHCLLCARAPTHARDC